MIHPNRMMALARGRLDDLRRHANRHPLTRHPRQPPHAAATQRAVTLRLADAMEDGDALARLAALDESSIPAGPVLLAFVDGEALAALSLTDDKAIADPFHRTAYLVDLLRARAHQLSARAARGDRDDRGHSPSSAPSSASTASNHPAAPGRAHAHGGERAALPAITPPSPGDKGLIAVSLRVL